MALDIGSMTSLYTDYIKNNATNNSAKTEAAVKAFQKDHGLVADGITGPRTWEALQTGQGTRFTVTIQHLSKTVAEELVTKYGGTMTAEEG